MNIGRQIRPILALIWVCCVAVSAYPDVAEGTLREYCIKSGDAVATLREFATQSGEQVIFLADQVRGTRTNAVKGRLTAERAMGRLLEKTRLQAMRDPSAKAWVVTRKEALPAGAIPKKTEP